MGLDLATAVVNLNQQESIRLTRSPLTKSLQILLVWIAGGKIMCSRLSIGEVASKFGVWHFEA